jgi:serine/threonine protein kinase
MIANKYEIQEKIGKGSFGSIYQGINKRTQEKVAIKVEPVQVQYKLLKNESIMYHYLREVKGIPNVKWFGKDENYYYMVIPLLGKSLEKIKEKYQRFSLFSTIQIGIKLIELVESIHEKGLIHRDIKPDNFLFGLENSQLYLIDFGFCKTYMNNGNHILPKQTNRLIGSANFASIHSHEHQELSRRDDLESIGYILYYLYYGELEWSNIDLCKDYTKGNVEIKKRKQKIIEKVSLPSFLKKFFETIQKIVFDEKPNYLFLTNMLRENGYCK